MEIGFYHPERGYWQTTEEPSDNIKAAYPEGTVEVPLKPSAHHTWIDGKWEYERPDWDKWSVSMEAERRINEGILINGIRFRCDTDSISRLEGLVRGFERGAVGSEGKTYKTSAGVDITFTTKEQVQAVLNAADDHRDWILERSAQIQNMEPVPDPGDPDLWEKPAP